MLTKLKYVGVSQTDLLEVYKLYIRSTLEYASVVFHSRLTQDQSNLFESIQKLCLKIIMGPDYTDYSSVLETLQMSSLYERRESRVISFSQKCLQHPIHKNMFPVSEKYTNNKHNIRNPEKYVVEVGRSKYGT